MMGKISSELLKASNTLLDIADKISSEALKDTGRMNPKMVSLISRVRSDIERLGTIVKAIGERAQSISEMEEGLKLAQYLYAFSIKDKLVVAKVTPRKFVITYDPANRQVEVSSSRFKAIFAPGSVKMVHRGFSIEFNPYEKEEYVKHYNEIKILVNELENVLNQKLVQSLNVKLGKIVA